MGSGRKRLMERSSGEGEVRKKKKGIKFKDRKESVASETTHKSSIESTATTEGRIMAQACSTFSRIEQSRFESFRRAAFPADAVSKYVAQCLMDEHYGETATTISATRRPPILSELVAPGHAEEICLVVSTLAKAYAQRLVTAARSLAAAASSSNNNNNGDEAIEPIHIMKAFQQRQGRGQDPGFFFMQTSSATDTNKTVLHDDETYQRKRLAALKAQDDHDMLLRQESTKTSKENADTED